MLPEVIVTENIPFVFIYVSILFSVSSDKLVHVIDNLF